MKTLNAALTGSLAVIALTVCAQTPREATYPLSRAAQKGFLEELKFSDNGDVSLIYQNKGSKTEIVREQYAFNSDFKLTNNETITTPVEIKPDIEKERVFAWVGACTSFDINSMKVRISRDKLLMKWDYNRHRYVRKKTLESETVKVKNEKGKFYYGIDNFYDETNGKIVLFVYMETKDKANPRQYAIVKVNVSGDVEEIPIELKGSYSIVYTQVLATDDNGDDDDATESGFIAVLASNQKGSFSNYVFLHYDLTGKEISKVNFSSPSPNLLVTGATERQGAVYLFGYSVKGDGGYKDEFDDYQPMINPCYKDYNNVQMISYTKKADRSMDFFHFIKIENGAMAFGTTAPMSSIKSKMKTPPSQKSGTPFKGGRFVTSNLSTSPGGEFLLTGQLVGWGFIRGVSSTVGTYGDIVCLHFDNQGQFKAQYAVDRIDDDKKSKVFRVRQNFYFSADGQTAYWEIWEVKGVKGYANFYDAFYNIPSFHARRYPRVGRIALASASLSDFKVLGDGKYFISDAAFLRSSNTIVYVGKDENEENIWLASLKLD
ncbi:MAG: hypothetical protein JNN04_17480 [Cyclobacteriaceae bacterium]|nr:hypothetical protein [Cyclobacteriaceae bacterium]